MSNEVDYSKWLPYCQSERQTEIVTACIEYGSRRKAAAELEINARSVDRALARIQKNAVRHNYYPEHDMVNPVPEGAIWGGNTGLYRHKPRDDDSPGLVMQWVRNNPDKQRELELINDSIDRIGEEIIPTVKIDYAGGKPLSRDFFSVIPVGDPHLGLLCWAQEVGVDWDISIALRVFQAVYTRLLSMVPSTNEVILVNTGDLFHADNVMGLTTRSHNRLDLDGRPGKWIDAAINLMQMILTACLRKYKKVHYINIPGNHDDILGLMMGVFIDTFYQKTDRLTVQRGNNPFQYVERNGVLLGLAHGHSCNLKALPGKMSLDQREAWGRTLLHHWITGHVHHKQMLQFKEFPGCSVESVGVIPPADSYAHGLGLGSLRDAQVLIFNAAKGYLPYRITEQVRSTD